MYVHSFIEREKKKEGDRERPIVYNKMFNFEGEVRGRNHSKVIKIYTLRKNYAVERLYKKFFVP